MWCGVFYGVLWSGVVWFIMVWCGVVSYVCDVVSYWSDVVSYWCGEVWCHMVWCGLHVCKWAQLPDDICPLDLKSGE